MSHAEEHRARSAAALGAAQRLRESNPEWALVPLFYSALQLLHMHFDLDHLNPVEKRHPKHHQSLRRDGRIVRWGTNDVAAAEYPEVSALYKSLYHASLAVRYRGKINGPPERHWHKYDELRARLDERSSSHA